MNVTSINSFLRPQTTQFESRTQETSFSEVVSPVLDKQPASTTTTSVVPPRELLDQLSPGSVFFTLPGMNLKETNEALMQQLHSGMKDFLNKHGFDSSQDVQLESGYDGRLYVANAHPNAAEINQLLESEPKLQQIFSRISANESLLAAVQRHMEFTKAYERDPARAVEEFQDLFNDSPKKVSRITISENDIQHQFVKASPSFDEFWS